MFGRIALAAITLLSLGATAPTERPGASKDIAGACGTRDGWSDPAPPAHIHGNTWYVGTCGITVVLIETKAGLVLIDTGPLEAAPHVLANIKALGFDPKAIKWILSTHEHFDHGGGIAAIQRETGAQLATGPFAAEALRTGKAYPDDPQATLLEKYPMPPARVDRVLHDRESLSLGDVRFVARATPTHSPGSTSWTWKACQGSMCRTITLLDSANTISAEGYRFSDHPNRVDAARNGLLAMWQMPCEILVTPHPEASNLLERLSGKAPLTDKGSCKSYTNKGRERLSARLWDEAGRP